MHSAAVLLVNLGTPASPSEQDVRQYLKQFLSDRDVIDLPRWQWLPILHGIVLRKRPQRVAKLYEEIWTEAGSPLLLYTKKQAELLQERMADRVVKYAMTYGEPSIPQRIQQFIDEGIQKITVIPLFPQYTKSTTRSIFKQVMTAYMQQTAIPHIEFIDSFYDHPLYIKALAEKINAVLAVNEIDKLLFSYHGIPTRYVEQGDPYQQQCEETTRLVVSKLTHEIDYETCYQSKFGKEPWLTPNLSDLMQRSPGQNVKKVVVVTPGFVSECLETVHEVEMENRELFMQHGGEHFAYVVPFNDDAGFIDLLEGLVREHL